MIQAQDQQNEAVPLLSKSVKNRGIPTGPPRERETLEPDAFSAQLAKDAPGELALTGTPKCKVEIYSLGYHTIGGHGEPTTATTGVMIPSGSADGCRGPLPVVLYAHGTSVDKNYDLANLNGDINQQNEGLDAAAFYAAQGFIVVVPNYAGYAGSTLSYAPFLNADQQAADMIDALRAARSTFLPIFLNAFGGKLFVTGYSQGGFVAMATQRAMQENPVEFRPTAIATGSGPYALSLLVDKEIAGAPSTLAPLLFNLISTSYQKSYGNVYAQPSDLFAPVYAANAEGLLPGTVPQNTLFAENILPERALFQTGSLPPPNVSNPDTAIVTEAGFAPTNFYMNTAYRDAANADISAHPCNDAKTGALLSSCAPTNGLRIDGVRNDLRTFIPKMPLQMCGAHSDTLVYFFNTQVAEQYFASHGVPPGRVSVIDLDPGVAGPHGPFASLQQGFLDAKSQDIAAAGNTPAGALQVASDIHTLAAPFCIVAARHFFQSFQ
ncbi:MAG: hypothetical protein JWQ49_4867 [Edaphobacter sp.]|nr:hypothetical protein [Edaphobacter sp.]